MAIPPTKASGADTILVVDDTPINLQVLVRILDGSGYRILAARNGRTALEIARQVQPDLVLLDVAMPGMDGFEVCRALREDPSTAAIIVIFLSAHGEVSEKVSGLELGAEDYITKPFQSQEVLARVRGHLLRKRLERDLRQSRDGLEREMTSAGEMQHALLPTALPADEGVTFAAHYRTSLHAGGDYYDVFRVDRDRIAIVVADVAGHGARAAIVMAMMRTLLHALEKPLDNPAQVFKRLNQHFAYLRGTALFATALYAVIEPRSRHLAIACAGHPSPLLVQADHTIRALDCERTLPLFASDLESVPVSDLALHPGDRVVFYTDGITERLNRSGNMFGLQRLKEALAWDAADGLDNLVKHVVEEIESFADGHEPDDDQTLLLAAVR
jgi:sigma-B regulation protein RsbU (phosphoserine phosphatase)